MPRTLIVEPVAEALVESLRSIGYSLPDAIADLVDNSVSAGARSVALSVLGDGAKLRMILSDNGSGMDEEGLIRAMRPGGISPTTRRSMTDLGRFGLGLKTASFSQCRRVTVVTRREGAPAVAAAWDLDRVTSKGRWELELLSLDEVAELLPYLPQAGTLVVWDRLDRASGHRTEIGMSRKRLYERLREVANHLALVFGPMLESDGLEIQIEQLTLTATDPFLRAHPKTKNLGRNPLLIPGHEPANVYPFVLPLRTDLDHAQWETQALGSGWTAQQGFYVFRNRRLLIGGSWLGLGFSKDEHHQLARIRVDISNDADDLWQIDVRKSRARPPEAIRESLRKIAALTRNRAAERYRRRGRMDERITGASELMWHRAEARGRHRFVVNRTHPAITAYAATLAPEQARTFSSVLAALEQSVPSRAIFIAAAESSSNLADPFEGVDRSVVATVFGDLVALFVGRGMSRAEAIDRLRSIEPFAETPELIDVLLKGD